MTTSIDAPPPAVSRSRAAIHFEILVTFGLFAVPFVLTSLHRYLTNMPPSRYTRALLYLVVFGAFAAYFQRTRRVTPIVGLHLLGDVGSGIRLALGG